MEAFVAAFALCGSLIVAIGAQNAFVLRQGLRREHVALLVAFCTVADLALVAAGVAGLGRLLQAWPALEAALTLGGAAFVGLYGLRALWRSRRGGTLAAGAGANATRRAVVAQAAAFTFLNPHVYLDTVLLVGAVGAQMAPPQRGAFIAGAGAASAVWFTAIGCGARWLAPWFARPRAWQVLDALIGTVMLVLAVQLARRVLP